MVTCGLDIAEGSAHGRVTPLQRCLFRESWSAHLPWLITCWKSSEAAANTDVVNVWTVVCHFEFTACSTFEQFQPVVQPDFYALPLVERASTHLSQISDTNLFRRILNRDGIIRKEDIIELESSNVSLLSIAMRSLDNTLRRSHSQPEWNQLLRELILLTDDHSVYSKDFKFNSKTGWEDSVPQGTALWACIYFTYVYGWHSGKRNSPVRHIQKRVFSWLKMLRECNVDLLSYGQREHEIIFGGARKRHEIRVWNKGSWMWTGFAWGPNPEDWTIHLDRVVERFVGDFWHMVDNPYLHVPGAWVDDDDSSDSEPEHYSEIDSDESEPETEGEPED